MSNFKSFFCLIYLLLTTHFLVAQENFMLQHDKSRAVIPFKLINNLIFIPIKVNGVTLTFLLDSGVEETILFSLENKKELNFFNAQKIRLRGLGSEQSIEGLKSTNNVLETYGLLSQNHLLFIIIDQSFDLSSHIGIPVNGIIGYKFFKNNTIEIDYQKKKLYVYNSSTEIKETKRNKFNKIPITIEHFKPYIDCEVNLLNGSTKAKLLIDLGNSDAVWMFQNDTLKLPQKKVEDFLGKGFSGDILGYRAKIEQFKIGDFVFNRPIASFPDSSSIRNVRMVEDRVGSVGGEILKRFTVILDYDNQMLYLKKNKNFKKPFQYNHSGITIQHNGLQWIKETVSLHPYSSIYTADEDSSNKKIEFKYEFKLKPIFEISSIRKNSAAEKAGLQKGDIIRSINNTLVHRLNLEHINDLLKSEGGKLLLLEVERNNQLIKFQVELIDEL